MTDKEKVYRARCVLAGVGRGLSQQNAISVLFDLFEVGDSGSGNVFNADALRPINRLIDESLVRADIQNNMGRKGR